MKKTKKHTYNYLFDYGYANDEEPGENEAVSYFDRDLIERRYSCFDNFDESTFSIRAPLFA